MKKRIFSSFLSALIIQSTIVFADKVEIATQVGDLGIERTSEIIELLLQEQDAISALHKERVIKNNELRKEKSELIKQKKIAKANDDDSKADELETQIREKDKAIKLAAKDCKQKTQDKRKEFKQKKNDIHDKYKVKIKAAQDPSDTSDPN